MVELIRGLPETMNNVGLSHSKMEVVVIGEQVRRIEFGAVLGCRLLGTCEQVGNQVHTECHEWPVPVTLRVCIKIGGVCLKAQEAAVVPGMLDPSLPQPSHDNQERL